MPERNPAFIGLVCRPFYGFLPHNRHHPTPTSWGRSDYSDSTGYFARAEPMETNGWSNFSRRKSGDRNTTDQQSFPSIAASAVACGFEYDVDAGFSDEFHDGLPEYWQSRCDISSQSHNASIE